MPISLLLESNPGEPSQWGMQIRIWNSVLKHLVLPSRKQTWRLSEQDTSRQNNSIEARTVSTLSKIQIILRDYFFGLVIFWNIFSQGKTGYCKKSPCRNKVRQRAIKYLLIWELHFKSFTCCFMIKSRREKNGT